MDEERIRAKLAGLGGQLAELRVRSLSLFGSAARGQARDDSDLDFLVEFDGRATFDGYMGLKELLERELEAPIDLVTVRALRPALRDQILLEAVTVA